MVPEWRDHRVWVSGEGKTMETVKPTRPVSFRDMLCHTGGLTYGSALAVLTDGVGDALTDIPHAASWFAERWQRPPSLASFLLDVDFDAAGQVDDRTAVVVWCLPAPRRPW